MPDALLWGGRAKIGPILTKISHFIVHYHDTSF